MGSALPKIRAMEKQPKTKMDPLKKAKLIYSGELFLFAILFAVLGALTLTNVWAMSLRRGIIFTWITIFGGPIGIGDFVWLCCSKKRQAKNSWIDKILMLPVALAVTVLAIIAFVVGLDAIGTLYYQVGMGSAFVYIACIYVFEGIYHYYHPVPAMLEEEKPQELQATTVEESKPEAKKEDETDHAAKK